MLGTLRLLLALMVAISHAGVRWEGLNPGVMAVVGFYAISGYVMTGLVRRHYQTPGRIVSFYADRAVRLLPAYYALAVAGLLWYAWHGFEPLFLERTPDWTDALNNLLIVPINFFMWNGSDKFSLVPPAWSLGCEIQFYLLFPIVLLLGLRLPAFVLSLAVFAAAFVGTIQTEWFGYRLLPGVLFVFLVGSWLNDGHHGGADGLLRASRITKSVVLLALIAGLAGWKMTWLSLPYNPEILIGLAVGMPLLNWLAPMRSRRWDERAGDLSYGLFLSHFLVYWAWPGVDAGFWALALRLLAALGVAWLIHRVIERPALVWRKALRTQRSTE